MLTPPLSPLPQIFSGYVPVNSKQFALIIMSFDCCMILWLFDVIVRVIHCQDGKYDACIREKSAWFLRGWWLSVLVARLSFEIWPFITTRQGCFMIPIITMEEDNSLKLTWSISAMLLRGIKMRKLFKVEHTWTSWRGISCEDELFV